MSERGQRTTLRFGGVSAEVSLLNTSGKPKAAQHETKRVLVGALTASEPIPEGVPVQQDGRGDVIESRAGLGAPWQEAPTPPPDAAGGPGSRVERNAQRFDGDGPREQAEAERIADGFGTWPSAPEVEEPRRPLEATGADPLGDDVPAQAPEPAPSAPSTAPLPAPATSAGLQRRAAQFPDAPSPEPQEYHPPATEVQQGVHLANGTWVDLTDRLREVDERTKVHGLDVVATIDTTSIPRERVRDAKYVAGVNPAEYAVLALLWRALRQTRRAAAVRFTKRTAQALGIIVARGGSDDAHLVLLELEWADNMRAPSGRVTGPITAEVDDREVAAAVELVDAFAAGPSAVNDLRDERLAKRAELLELARSGQLDDYTPPAEPMPELEDVGVDRAGVLLESASWLREHAAV